MNKKLSFPSRRPKKYGAKIYAASFSLYVGTGPVYWMPWADPRIIYGIKIFLFAIVAGYPMIADFASRRDRGVNFPGGNVSVLIFFLFLIFSIPAGVLGIGNGNLEEVVRRTFNTFQVMVFLYSCGYAIKKQFIQEIVRKAVIVISLVCVISIVGIVLMPNYPSPLNDDLSLFQTGFGGSRTGWAPSIALYLPWLYSLKLLPATITLLVLVAMVGNQISVAGRAGLLASFIPFGLWGWLSRRWKIFFISLIGLSIGIIYAIINAEALRLSSGRMSGADGLDELSSGRWEQYEVAIRAIMESPLTGYGIGPLYYDGTYWTVHNIILRFAIEGGVIYAMLVIAILLLPIIKISQRIGGRNISGSILAAGLTIISGLINSMFEPEGMFGTFNQVCFWWVCYAICVSSGFRGTDLDVRAR